MLQEAVWLNTMLNFINFVNNGLEVKDHHVPLCSLSVCARCNLTFVLRMNCCTLCIWFIRIPFYPISMNEYYVLLNVTRKKAEEDTPKTTLLSCVCRYLVMRRECIFFGCDAILSMWSTIHIFLYVWMHALYIYVLYSFAKWLRHTHARWERAKYS